MIRRQPDTSSITVPNPAEREDMNRTHLRSLFICESHALLVPAGCSRDKVYVKYTAKRNSQLVQQAWIAAERVV
jgi:hypothetical protein